MRYPIYLDHAATTPVRPEVFNSMKPYLTVQYGNPSSAYQAGERSKQAIEKARAIIADCIHADAEEIYFTSGGSESDNWALKGVVDYNRFRQQQSQSHIMTSAIEHPAVLKSAMYLERKGIAVDYLPVSRKGVVDVAEMQFLTNPYTVLISVMFANNEIGTIQPVAQIGQYARSMGIVFHTDAVQAFGQIPIDVKRMEIDLLSASAHKLGGPKGIGFLYVRKGCPLEPYIHGGGQERGNRSGTENVAAIVGMGKAAELAQRAMLAKISHVKQTRDALLVQLRHAFPNCIVNGADCQPDYRVEADNAEDLKRLPGNLNVTIPNCNVSEVIARLDQKGILVSAGSACSAHKSGTSHVLAAIGVSETDAASTIRFSLGEENTISQMQYVTAVLKHIIKV
jgi:cysteine desulfurase